MERDQRLEGDFYDYMHQSGEVDPDWNRRVLSHYVPYFAQCSRVLDVGCGQGDFLELLRAVGVEGVGVDVDAGMVGTCLQKGLDAVEADAFDYLPQCKGRFDGIFSSNLIEHLSADDATRFVKLSFDALVPGGLLLIATPNPASPIVHLHEFWRDATHVRLYNGALLEFLLDWAGFVEIQSSENPVTGWKPSRALRAVPEHLRELTSLRRAMLSGTDTGRSEARTAWLSEADCASDGSGGALKQGTSWGRRRDARVTGSRRESILGRLVFSFRRRLARFLADTILFEEFAALADGFSMVARMSFTAQKIEKALYDSHNNRWTTPREVFASGAKPSDREIV